MGVRTWGFLVLALLNVVLDHWWKGWIVATIVRYAVLTYALSLLGFQLRAGYLRRKPYWTRESWRRFLRLMAQPVGALVVLFAILYFFDPSQSTFGNPQSATRVFWIIVLVALMAFGAIGLPVAVDWMGTGEPSEQFTRTRWFTRPVN